MDSKAKLDDPKVRKAMQQHNATNEGIWNQVPTPIHVGVSRQTGIQSTRNTLMTGARPTSRTSQFNPTSGMNFNTTVAPMVPRSKEPPNGRPHKRTRKSEPMEHTKAFRGSPDQELQHLLARPSGGDLMRQPTSGPAGHSTVDKERKRRSSLTSGDLSDDPINSFRDDSKANKRRQGTPTGNTTFTSINETRAKYESIHDPKLPPMAPFVKRKRIANMKDKEGKPREHIKLSTSKKPVPAPSFTGSTDILSQPSLAKRSPRKPEVRTFDDYDEPVSKLRIPITKLVIGTTQYRRNAHLDFHVGTAYFDLHLSGDDGLRISSRDVNWKKTDNFMYLFICVIKGGKLQKTLEEHKLWEPLTLASEFPNLTISMQFTEGKLGDPRIMRVLEGIRSKQSPPGDVSKLGATVVWNRVMNSLSGEKRMPKSDDELFDGSISERSPSPKRASRAIRSSAIISTESTVRRSSRGNGVPKTDLENDEIMLVYPFTGTGSTQITRGEHQRLQPGEFLNDTLIEFGLRHWLESLKEANPTLASQVHVFSPFFFKKLKHKDPQAGYDAVKKWTNKVDIFQKRYLVVPINERVHWYLAVVLFPDNLLRAIQDKQPEVHVVSSGEPNQDALDVQIVQQQEAGQFMIQGRAVETPDPSSLPVSRAESVEDVQMSEDVDMREETGLLAVSDHEDRSPASSPGPPAIEEELLDIGDDEEPCDESWKTNTDAVWLLSFDSLGGKHPSALRTLRKYLLLELKQKKGFEFNNEIPIMQTKVPSPVQPNFCDCGVYLVKTAEMFLGQPGRFFQRLMDKDDKLTEQHPLWDPTSFGTKREEMFQTVAVLGEEWRSFKNSAGAEKVSVPANSKPTDAPKQNEEPLITKEDDGDDDDIEIVGEVSAPKKRAQRRTPAKTTLRGARRLS